MSKLFGERLKVARKNKGYTIKQLHELTGISTGQISEAENGKTTLGGEKLISVCRILDMDLRDTEIEGNAGVIVNGHGAHIDVHHGDTEEEFNPAIRYVISIVKNWDDQKLKKLVETVISMDV